MYKYLAAILLPLVMATSAYAYTPVAGEGFTEHVVMLCDTKNEIDLFVEAVKKNDVGETSSLVAELSQQKNDRGEPVCVTAVKPIPGTTAKTVIDLGMMTAPNHKQYHIYEIELGSTSVAYPAWVFYADPDSEQDAPVRS